MSKSINVMGGRQQVPPQQQPSTQLQTANEPQSISLFKSQNPNVPAQA
jgi:hypothetical protein